MCACCSLEERCHELIGELSRTRGWGLSQHQIAAYAGQILGRVPSHLLESQLEQVIGHYHADHLLVAALADPRSPDHAAAWIWVAQEITRATKIAGLAWSKDRAVEIEDLVQTVQAEVVRVLGSYHYASSLRTWLQSVTIRRLRRYHRDAAAAKRSGCLGPLGDAVEQPVEWVEFEPQVMAALLKNEIYRVLATSGDERYARIFHLRVVQDQSAEEIGAQFRLHASRVRVLFRFALTLLQEDPALRAWNYDRGEADGRGDWRKSA